LLSSKPYIHKDRVNNFSLFDDDKPNDHIDYSREKKFVKCQACYSHKSNNSKEKFLRRSTKLKSKKNKQGHPIFPLLASSKKRGFRANRLKQGVCNHHLLGNRGKTTCNTLKYMVR